MVQRGRKPKPTAIKVFEGNSGKTPLNKNEPKLDKKTPKCPTWLEKEAKNEWRRMSKTLEVIGVLTQVNASALRTQWRISLGW